MNIQDSEAQAVEVARELGQLMDAVEVPAADLREWMPERFWFLLARQNFNDFLDAREAGKDILAGNITRALFEEAMRWSWVDEDATERRAAFLGEAAWRYEQVDEAGRALGIDPDRYYGPFVPAMLTAAVDAPRFPWKVQGQLDWTLGYLDDLMYNQYRLLCQYTHSSMLASASATVFVDGNAQLQRLPPVARVTILRNAVADIAVICMGCEPGLQFDYPMPLSITAMSYADQVAELLQAAAPASE